MGGDEARGGSLRTAAPTLDEAAFATFYRDTSAGLWRRLGGPLGELMTASAWLPVILGAVLAPLVGLVAFIFFLSREAC